MADTTLIRTSYNKDADIKIMWIEKIASEILNCISRINEGNEPSRAQMELKSGLFPKFGRVRGLERYLWAFERTQGTLIF